jgi:hypothetical protein
VCADGAHIPLSLTFGTPAIFLLKENGFESGPAAAALVSNHFVLQGKYKKRREWKGMEMGC